MEEGVTTMKKRMLMGWAMAAGCAWAVVASEEPSWLAPAVGPFSPNAHVHGAVGSSSGDVEELAEGHHDPSREDGSVQGVELGTALRLGWLEGSATYVFSYGAEEEWEDEWEEAFLKVKDLPGGFEARGGRMLGRFGKQNAEHLHAWSFVDMPIVISRFLGEHGLWFDGGDVTWLKQDVATTYGLTVAYGEYVGHDHEHGHAEEEHEHEEEHGHEEAGHAHVEEEHADEYEHAEDEHEDEHEHAEGIVLEDGVASGRLFVQWRPDDFRLWEVGCSLVSADEESGRSVLVYGLDASYVWREKGLEAGGRQLTLTTELLYRDVESGGEAHDHAEEEGHEEHAEAEEAEHDHADHEQGLPGGAEFGFYSQAVLQLDRALDLGLRLGYVEGDASLSSSERFQVSPAVTAYLDPYRRTLVRLQYNYDDVEKGDDVHTAWLQFGLSWGGAEVR